jgi:hypothetical protein
MKMLILEIKTLEAPNYDRIQTKLGRGMNLSTVKNRNLLDRITYNPEICHGAPCIRGLRYPV